MFGIYVCVVFVHTVCYFIIAFARCSSCFQYFYTNSLIIVIALLVGKVVVICRMFRYRLQAELMKFPNATDNEACALF